MVALNNEIVSVFNIDLELLCIIFARASISRKNHSMAISVLFVSGSKLKTLRQNARLKQSQLAEMLGVPQAQISIWETRSTRIRINRQVLDRITDVRLRTWLFNCGIEDLKARLQGKNAFGILPAEFVLERFDVLFQSVTDDLRHRWFAAEKIELATRGTDKTDTTSESPPAQ